MPHPDPDARRAAGRERQRRLVAARRAGGLCVRCGREQAGKDGGTCKSCRQKRRIAERARAERRRKAGIRRVRSPQARKAEYQRARQRAEDRLARGLCGKCGVNPNEPARRLCAACGERARQCDRERYARAREAGLKYGGQCPEKKRSSARRRSRKLRQQRLDVSLCVRCGKSPPVEGRSDSTRCREIRAASDRATYARRRADGRCTRCGATTFQGEAVCGPCAVIESRRQPARNAGARRRYHDRRVRHICTHCGSAPSFGTSRCEPCARKVNERAEHVKILPVYAAEFTVLHAGTAEPLGVFEDWEDVVLCLAFAGLEFEEVDVLTEHAPMRPVLTGFS